MNIPATPPTGWFNFFVDGGLAAVFFVLTVILTLLARELAKRLDAMYEKRLVEQKQCETEKVELLNKVLETQTLRSSVGNFRLASRDFYMKTIDHFLAARAEQTVCREVALALVSQDNFTFTWVSPAWRHYKLAQESTDSAGRVTEASHG